MLQKVVFFNRESTRLFQDVPAWWNITIWTYFLVYDEGPFLNYQPCEWPSDDIAIEAIAIGVIKIHEVVERMFFSIL